MLQGCEEPCGIEGVRVRQGACAPEGVGSEVR